MTVEQLTYELKKKLSPKRFMHTLAVRDTALYLGHFILPDALSELEWAALLHDVAKELTPEEQIDLLGADYDNLTDAEKAAPLVYHAYTAPKIIKRDYPTLATDRVLSAVFKHTTLDGDATLFDEIIFIADYIEPNRTLKGAIDTRDYLLRAISDNRDESIHALHRACLMSLDNTLAYLASTSHAPVERSLRARDFLIDKIKNY